VALLLLVERAQGLRVFDSARSRELLTQAIQKSATTNSSRHLSPRSRPSSDSQSTFIETVVMENQANAPPNLLKVAQFLRGSGAGMKTRVGVLNGKRVDYFKGECICHS
jgi:hypothetical protein